MTRRSGGANEARTDVLFIDASKECTPGMSQNVMNEAHIAKVLETYRNRTEIEKYSHLASLAEIAGNDFSLSIPRYVNTFEAEEDIDLAALQQDSR